MKTSRPPLYAKPTQLASLLARNVLRQGRRMVRLGVNLLLPPRCLSCSEPLHQHGTLCAICWPSIRWIRAPHCSCCGLPFPHGMGEGALCAGCLAQAPTASFARSAMAYDGGSRRLVARFKYQDATLLAPVLGEWMTKAGSDVLTGAELVVPVPLHWRRLIWRRFNQAALLGAEIGKRTGLPMLPRAMYRTRHTKPQAALTRAQRLRNVQGLFKVDAKQMHQLHGKIILLVDDVHTTGATLEACAKALLKSGAKEVRCLTLARTVFD